MALIKHIFTLLVLITAMIAPSLIAMSNDTRSAYQQELDNQLLTATEKNDLKQTQLLLYAGANPNVYTKDHQWETVLMRVAYHLIANVFRDLPTRSNFFYRK